MHNSQNKLTCPHCSSTNILLDARTGAVCRDCGKKYCNVKSSCCGAESIRMRDMENDIYVLKCAVCRRPFIPTTEGECKSPNCRLPKGHGENCEVKCHVCIYATQNQYPALFCSEYLPCKYHSGEPFVPPESSAWMEEEREAFCREFTINSLDAISAIKAKNLIADYWLSRMAETREAARKEGYEIATRDLKNKYDYAHRANIEGKIAREQGRQEERERVVKMIEEKARHWHAKFTKKEYLKILEWANELLANLKENE